MKTRVGGVKETDVGIVAYANKDKSCQLPLKGVLKHRYRDFIVSEIAPSGEIAEINTDSISKLPDAADEDTKMTEEQLEVGLKALEPVISSHKMEELRSMILGYLSKERADETSIPTTVVMFDPMSDKSKRARLHGLIREHFGDFVVTDTKTSQSESGEKITTVRAVLHSHSVSKRNARKNSNKVAVDWRSAKKMSGNEPKGILKFVLYKVNVETQFVADKIGTFLSSKRGRGDNRCKIGFAGMKDKRAVTAQFVTINRHFSVGLISRLRGIINRISSNGNIAVGNFEAVENPLRLGDLRGNKFVVTIRDVAFDEGAAEDLKTNVERRIEGLKKYGFVNYFGLQRFGVRAEQPTHRFGLLLLLGRYSQFIGLLFSVCADDNESIARGKAKFREALELMSFNVDEDVIETPSDTETVGKVRTLILEAKELIPFYLTAEKKILYYFEDNLGDSGFLLKVKEAVLKIPFRLRNLYLHSFQSLIFNKLVTERIAKYGNSAVEGDLCSTYYPDEAVVLTTDSKEKFTIFDVVLPLPGYDVSYPTNDVNEDLIKRLISEEIEKTGSKLKMADLNLSSLFRKSKLSGKYRKIFQKVDDIEHRFISYSDEDQDLFHSVVDKMKEDYVALDETSGDKLALQLSFSLPQSTYATMLFREVMRFGTDLESVKQGGKISS